MRESKKRCKSRDGSIFPRRNIRDISGKSSFFFLPFLVCIFGKICHIRKIQNVRIISETYFWGHYCVQNAISPLPGSLILSCQGREGICRRGGNLKTSFFSASEFQAYVGEHSTDFRRFPHLHAGFSDILLTFASFFLLTFWSMCPMIVLSKACDSAFRSKFPFSPEFLRTENY